MEFLMSNSSRKSRKTNDDRPMVVVPQTKTNADAVAMAAVAQQVRNNMLAAFMDR
jgi:hypothetical protein